jgi:hypothetical protein
MTRGAPLLSWLLVVALVLVASAAAAVDRNFAGSVQVDYLLVPTSGGNLNQGTAGPFTGGAVAPGGNGWYGFDGFTIEASEKVAIDVSDHLSANVKVCFGCHGFELDMAYADYRFADELNLRVGRFSPTFGGFNLRHDVANHKLSDKPLPYDMGRMLRLRAWNLGVLPSPFPDNGVEINGTHWFGDGTEFDYAVYGVQGFRSGDAHPVDIDFTLSRTPYYVDNNGIPAVGGRVALTQKLGEMSDVTLGTSAVYGTYDSSNELAYAIVGGDVSLRVFLTNVRIEYLVRRTQIDVTDPARLALPVSATGDEVYKHGAYVEVEQPLSPALDMIARVDGLYRVGNFLADPTDETPLARRSSVVRYTLGASYAFERGFRLKLSTELWNFSDADDDGHTLAVGLHAAFVAAY